MIYQKIKSLLNTHTDLTKQDLSNIEHLIVNQLFDSNYFQDIKLDLYMNDMENITFYNGSQNSVNTIPPEDFSNTGGYVITNEEVERLKEVQNVLNSAQSMNDLMFKINETDVTLIQKFSVNSKKDDFYYLLALVRFKEILAGDPDYKISNKDYYANNMLLICVEDTFHDNENLKYTINFDETLKKHFKNEIKKISQEEISHTSLKRIMACGNKTFFDICRKKLIKNPDVNDDQHKEIYSDLSSIYNNPLIKENTILGIIFDDQLTGPEKIFKIYEKQNFAQVKERLISTINLQISKPTIESLYQKYANVIDLVVQEIRNLYPILNLPRTENVYFEKSTYDFSKYLNNFRNKENIGSKDLLIQERNLLNSGLDGYFYRILEPNSIMFVGRSSTDPIKMHDVNVVNYHNDIESLILIRTLGFTEKDLPAVEKPKIVILEQFTFPLELAKQSFDILNSYIDEQKKNNISVVINNNDFYRASKHKEDLDRLEDNSNVIVCNLQTFDLKMNHILKCLDMYDKEHKVLKSDEKTHLISVLLDKLNIDFPDHMSNYDLSSNIKLKEFIQKNIEEEVLNGFKYRKQSHWASI